MDIFGPYPVSDNNRYILAVITFFIIGLNVLNIYAAVGLPAACLVQLITIIHTGL